MTSSKVGGSLIRFSSTLITWKPNSVCTGFSVTSPGFEREGGSLEWRHHLAPAEEAEVAAVLAARVFRLLGEFLEFRAALQLLDDLLGLFLGVDEDVACVHLLLGLVLRDDDGLVGLLQVLLRQGS